MKLLDLAADDVLAPALLRARAAFAAGRYGEASEAYGEALAAAEGQPDAVARRTALAVEHMGQLAASGRLDDAARLAQPYLDWAEGVGEPGASLALRVLLSEVLWARGDLAGSLRSLESAERLQAGPGVSPDTLVEWRPALLRLQGLHGVRRGDPDAVHLLDAAGAAYAQRGDTRGMRVVAGDLQRLALEWGDGGVVGEILDMTGADDASLPELLARARALRRDGRYQAAARLLIDALQNEVDPALRFPVLLDLVQLHRLLGEGDTAERLLPLLREAAALAGDPGEAAAALDRAAGLDSLSPVADFEGWVHHVRLLVEKGRLEEAGQALRALRPQASSPRREAYWSLAAGEQALAAGRDLDEDAAAERAEGVLEHLERARTLALAHSLPEVHVQALRLFGRVHGSLRKDAATASAYWSRAQQSDEIIAHRQETDTARIRYLESRPSLHDEQVEAAGRRVARADERTLALAVAALEGARSASVLSLILPRSAPSARALPRLNDLNGAWDWCAALAAELPGDLAVWMIHITPSHVHHALIARGFLRYELVPADRQALVKEVDGLNACWRYGSLLQQAVAADPGRITGHLGAIAERIVLRRVFAGVPEQITRLAVVAGGALGDVPFAALPLVTNDGAEQPLVRRFAVSYQPCLSAYLPLRARGKASRGRRTLVVRPPDAYLGDAEPGGRCTMLCGEAASVSGLEALLEMKSFRIVQVDCHGRHDAQSGRDSWLQLAPGPGDDGRFTAGRLQNRSLERCGTLVLGACESGMTQRLGREERVGFIRAGLAAGATAVLAAQWVAEDGTAAFILSRFRRYLQYFPRDIALQRAQLAFLEAGGTTPRSLPEPYHPAWWACWNLHGDPGFQTRAPGFLRTLRRAVATFRSVP